MSNYCSKCGAANEQGWKFCVSCGSELSAPARSYAPPSTAPPSGAAPAPTAAPSGIDAQEQSCPASPQWGPGAAASPGEHRAPPQPDANAPQWGSPGPASGAPSAPGQPYARQYQAQPPRHFACVEAIPHPDLPVAQDSLSEIISKAFRMYFANFGAFFGTYWVMMLIVMFAAMIAAFIPFVGNLAQFLVSPILVGVYFVFLKTIRGHRTDIGDAFSCLSEKYVPALIATLVQGFLTAVPVLAIVFITMGGSIIQLLAMNDPSKFEDWDFWKGLIFNYVIAIVLIGLVMLFVNFVMPLIADDEHDFWRAITRSVVFVWRHYWEVFLLSLIAGFMAMLGLLLLLIGVIFTAPLYFVFFMAYYEARKGEF